MQLRGIFYTHTRVSPSGWLESCVCSSASSRSFTYSYSQPLVFFRCAHTDSRPAPAGCDPRIRISFLRRSLGFGSPQLLCASPRVSRPSERVGLRRPSRACLRPSQDANSLPARSDRACLPVCAESTTKPHHYDVRCRCYSRVWLQRWFHAGAQRRRRPWRRDDAGL